MINFKLRIFIKFKRKNYLYPLLAAPDFDANLNYYYYLKYPYRHSNDCLFHLCNTFLIAFFLYIGLRLSKVVFQHNVLPATNK